MIFKPREHQQLGVNHLLANDEACLFAGMGLGKTATTLFALSQLILDGACKGALIVAPLRVSVLTWPDEVAKWSNFRFMKIVSLRTPEGIEAWKRGDACIYTINYEALFKPSYDKNTGHLKKDTGILGQLLKGRSAEELPVDTVVWDELSLTKNPSSKRIRAFLRHRDKFKRHWGLTGTPVPNSYLDLFAQLRLIDGGKTFGNAMQPFKIQYFYPTDYNQYNWAVRPDCIGLIEEKLKHRCLTLRTQDWLDIPPGEEIDVPVALPASVKPLYKKLEKELILRINDGKIKAVNQAVLVGKLQQFLGGAVYAEDLTGIFDTPEGEKHVVHVHDAKIKALRALWKREGHQPMLVATQFIHERQRILEAFPEAVEFSTDKVADWNAGKIGLFVAHPASMKYGLNMQKGGSRTCWFTPTYSFEAYDQFNARVYRTGQTSESKFFRLLVSGTIDDAVIGTLDRKGETQDALLTTLKNIQKLAS